MEFILIGIAVAFNIIIVVWKFRRGRLLDGLLDSLFLVLVALLFSVSTAALIVGTIGSLIVSLYLLISPPRFSSSGRSIAETIDAILK